MKTQYEKNKEFFLSDKCNSDSPLAAEFAKNCRLFMAQQSDFTSDDRKKYHEKLQRDIDRLKHKHGVNN